MATVVLYKDTEEAHMCLCPKGKPLGAMVENFSLANTIVDRLY